MQKFENQKKAGENLDWLAGWDQAAHSEGSGIEKSTFAWSILSHIWSTRSMLILGKR